jgi:hypothetical protein
MFIIEIEHFQASESKQRGPIIGLSTGRETCEMAEDEESI